MDKNELRKYYLNLRDNIPLEEQKKSSEFIFNFIKKEFIRVNKDILIFANIKSEVRTIDFIKELLNEYTNRVFVPKVINKNIEFYHINDLSELSKGYMGILEPDINRYNLKSDYNDDSLIIMPGAVFDFRGNRIGYGGGYYDRFLNAHQKMLKIGIIYDIQLSNELIDNEEHDIKADYIITNKGIININE